MKKLLILLVIINVIALKAESTQKWEILFDNIKGSARNVEIFDETIYVNTTPTIFKSTDDGKTFEQLYLGTQRSMMSMCFIDENTGWAVGYNGIVVHTTNGGNTWIDRSLDNLNRLSYIKFLDKNTGFVSGQGGYFTKTTDGGKSWKDIDFNIDADFGDVKIDHNNNLWLIGGKTTDYQRNESYGLLYHSTDLGSTWQKIDVPKLEEIHALEIIDNSIFLGSKNGTIYHSTDLGKSWTINKIGIRTPIFEIKMQDELVGYAVGGWTYGGSGSIIASDGSLPKKVFKSETGGLQEMNNTSAIRGDFANGAIMFVTHDGGKSWEPFSWFKGMDHIFGLNFHNGTIYVNGGNRGRLLKFSK